MRIVVTGGAGFIGSYMCHQLMSKGHSVLVIDIDNYPKGPKAAFLDGVEYLQADIIDTEKMIPAMQGADMVVHLAAKHRFFGVTEAEFHQVNVEGTQSILTAMNHNGVDKIIFYSTVAVYGDQSAPTTERTTPKPNTPYGTSKLGAEKLIGNWADNGAGHSAIIIRPTVVFGPHNRGNVYRLIRQIYHHLYYPVGKGDNIKSIAFVKNIVGATIHHISRGFSGIEIYNYTDTPDMPFNEILETIYSCLGRKMPAGHLKYETMLKIGSLIDCVLDFIGVNFSVGTAIQKINKSTHHRSDKMLESGYIPMCSSKEALEEMVHWYQSQLQRKDD